MVDHNGSQQLISRWLTTPIYCSCVDSRRANMVLRVYSVPPCYMRVKNIDSISLFFCVKPSLIWQPKKWLLKGKPLIYFPRQIVTGACSGSHMTVCLWLWLTMYHSYTRANMWWHGPIRLTCGRLFQCNSTCTLHNKTRNLIAVFSNLGARTLTRSTRGHGPGDAWLTFWHPTRFSWKMFKCFKGLAKRLYKNRPTPCDSYPARWTNHQSGGVWLGLQEVYLGADSSRGGRGGHIIMFDLPMGSQQAHRIRKTTTGS